ncbi:MAG: PKD domain-containing protein [Bacteroidota bacterium]
MKKLYLLFVLIVITKLGIGQITVSLSADDTVGCINLSTNIYAHISGSQGSLIYNWSSNSNFTLINDSIINVLILQSDIFTLNVTDSLNNTYTSSININLSPNPNPIWNFFTDSICQGDTNISYSVINQSGHNYNWLLSGGGVINDGQDSNQININWTSTGNWLLQLIDSIDNGCVVSITKNVHVFQKISPNFTFTPNNSCSGTTIHFTNLSTPTTGVKYLWDFGDNTTSISKNPSHTYSNLIGDGNINFNVKLTVYYLTLGCSHDTIIPVTVKKNPSAQLMDWVSSPAFTHCAVGGIYNIFNLVVTNTSTTKLTNASYYIDWGDNTTNYINSSMINDTANHTYTNLGSFNIHIIVTGQDGCVTTNDYSVFNGGNPAISLGNPGATIGCLPQTFVFPIYYINSQGGANPPGTKYTISINDGSPDTVFYQPSLPDLPPSSYTHTFDKYSCGVTSYSGLETYPNSFQITITAQNPCGATGVTVTPINISSKPITGMGLSPSSSVCVNSQISFYDSTKLSCYIPNVVSLPVLTYKRNWEVTPDTGWIIQSGKLGNLFPTNDTTTWGSGVLTLNFISSGIYTIKLFTGNHCGDSIVTKTVCISPIPISKFVISDSVLCKPDTLYLINQSSASNLCGNVKYTWKITSLSSTCALSTNYYTYINNTTDTTLNPEVVFYEPGYYQILLKVENGCTPPDTISRFITVRSKPFITNNTTSSIICAGSAITPFATFTSCNDIISYLWSFPNGIPSSSTNSTPGSIFYNSSGIFNYSIKASNSCGDSIILENIVVNPLPLITTKSNIEVCPGNIISIGNFVSTSMGATFSWVNSNSSIGLANSGNGNILDWTAPQNNTGTNIISTITVTPYFNGCYGMTISFMITIYAKPSLTQISNITVCSGQLINLGNFLSNPTNAQIIWTNTNTNIGLLASGSGNISNWLAPNNSTGSIIVSTITVIPTLNSCIGNPMIFTITILPIPVLNQIPDVSVCSGALINIGNFVSIPSNIIYSWTNSNTSIGLGNIGSSNITSWIAPLNISGANIIGIITVTPYINSCGGNPMSFKVIVKPSPVISSISNINICPGQTVSVGGFIANPVNSTFSWTNTDTLIGLAATGIGNISNWIAPSNNTGLNITGIINVTPINNGCFGANTSFIINIKPTPTINSVSDISACPSSFINIGNFSSLPTGANYTWTNSNTSIGILANGIGNLASWIAPQNNSSISINGTITVIPSLNGCIGLPKNFLIQIKPTPTVNNISNYTFCPGDTINIGNFTSNPVGSIYSWTNNNIAIGLGSSGSGTISSWIAPQNISGNNISGIINVTPTLNGCIGNSTSFNVLIKQSATINTVTNIAVCSGGIIPSQIFISNPSNSTINWTNSNSNIGLALTGSGNILSWIAPANLTSNIITGLITITPVFNSCLGIPINYNISIYPTPNVVATPNNESICSGTNTQIDISSSSTGTTFNWIINVPSGISGCSPGTGNQISQVVNSTLIVIDTVYYVITPSIGGCSGNSITVPVEVKPKPIISIIPQTQTICSGDSTSILSFSSNINGTTYNWIASAPVSISGFIPLGTGNVPKLLLLNNSSVSGVLNYIVTPISNGCSGISSLSSINIKPTPTITNSSLDQYICSGNSSSLINLTSNVINTTFNWNVIHSGAITGFISSGTNQIPIQLLTNIGTFTDSIVYHISTSANSCLGNFIDYRIIVSPLPKASFIQPTSGCHPLEVLFQNQSTPTPLNYLWDFGNNQFSTFLNPIMNYVNNSNYIDTAYSVKLKATVSSSGCSDTIIHSLIVYPKPKADFLFSDDSVCAPAVININNISISKGITTYLWNVLNSSNVIISNPIASNPTLTFLDNQSGIDSIYLIRLIVSSVDGCKDTLIKNVKVFSRPVAKYVIDSVGCSPLQITPINFSLYSSSYNWSVLPTTNITITTPLSFSPTISLPVNNSITYLYYKILLTAINSNSCKDTITHFIKIYPNPNVNFTTSNTDTCSVLTELYTNTSNPNNGEDISTMTFYWDFGNGGVSNLQNTSSNYTNTGITDSIYQVSLIASTLHGCKDTTIKNIIIHPNPKAYFSPLIQLSCAPFVLTNTIINPQLYLDANDTMKWYVNNNLIGIGNEFPGYTIYNENDSVIIKLIASNIHECQSDTFQLTFNTIINPVAKFSSNPSAGGHPLNVNFTNQSYPIPLTYSWDFNNGQLSNLLNPSITFTNTGVIDSIYKIRLVVISDSTGCRDTIVHSVTVNPLPIVNFNSSNVCIGLPINFTDSSINTTGIINNWHWEFGDGDTSNIKNPIHTYLSPGNYIVTLTITNTNNISNTITKIITIYPNPDVQFNNDSLACKFTSNVQFTNNTTNGQSYLWNFGDGNYSTLVSPFHIYNAQGYYNIKLIATSPYQCKDSISSIIHIVQLPISDFTLSTYQGCSPLDVTIQNQSSGYNTNYLWNLGIGNITSLNGPFSITYPQGDYDTTYVIKLTTSNICGSVIKFDTIVVKPKPKVDFGISQSWGCSPLTIQFIDTIRGLPDTLKWNFGDGSPVIKNIIFGHQIAHAFFYTGINDTIYNVELIAINACGSDTLIKQIHVFPNTVNAFMGIDTLKGCVPLHVQFSNYSTANTTSFWNFGDGNVSNSHNPDHQYQNPGNYITTLVVTNGCSYDTTRSDTIRVLPYAKPVITFIDFPCAEQIVSFSCPLNDITNYIWDFGDSSSISLLTNPQHIYNTSGVYQVNLSVNNQYNCPSDTTMTIHVKFKPHSLFTENFNSGCTPLNIQFTNQTDSLNYNTYIWKFGNGNSSVLTTPFIQTFINNNACNDTQFHVVLIANSSGCIDSNSATITVHSKPLNEFSTNNSIYCNFGT